MSDLVAVTYPDQHRAAEVFALLQRIEAERLADLGDAVFITKDYKGNVMLHQAVNLTGIHAASSTVWKALIPLLFADPTLRAATDTTGHTLPVASSDSGIDGQFIKDLGTHMLPGSSAIFVLVHRATGEKIGAEISKYGGTVLSTSLPPDTERRLQASVSGTKS